MQVGTVVPEPDVPSPDAPEPDAPDVVLAGRYELLEVVGSGGMGLVWRAHDRLLGRQVAVKVLSDDMASTSDGAAQLRAEATLAAQVRHPNVVQVLDAVFDDGVAAIVMELIDGPDLADVARGGRLPLERVLTLVDGIAAGIDAVHRAGVVHRDLSPRNVLLDNGVPRLTDFGVARAQATADDDTTTVRGSAGYLAPEQATGGEVGPAADVYALGCLITKLLTGHAPFDADTPVGVVYQHVRTEPPDLRARCPDVPAHVAEAVAAALAKDPAARPADMAAFLESLGRRHTLERSRVARPAGHQDVPDAVGTATRVIDRPPPASPARRGPGPVRLALVAAAVMLLAAFAVAAARPTSAGSPSVAAASPVALALDLTPQEQLVAELGALRAVLDEQHASSGLDGASYAELAERTAVIDALVADGRMRDAETALAELRTILDARRDAGGVTADAETAVLAAADGLADALAAMDDSAVAEPATVDDSTTGDVAGSSEGAGTDSGTDSGTDPGKGTGKAKGKDKGAGKGKGKGK